MLLVVYPDDDICADCEARRDKLNSLNVIVPVDLWSWFACEMDVFDVHFHAGKCDASRKFSDQFTGTVADNMPDDEREEYCSALAKSIESGFTNAMEAADAKHKAEISEIDESSMFAKSRRGLADLSLRMVARSDLIKSLFPTLAIKLYVDGLVCELEVLSEDEVRIGEKSAVDPDSDLVELFLQCFDE